MSKERAAQLVDAGIWLKLSGDREGARKLFERALKLDPENAKAAQLLAGGEEPPPPPPSAPGDVPIAPAIAPVAQPAANPFEPPSASPPGPNERDWNLATQKPAPAPLEPSLDADWGRLTGASTPVPQAPPPGSEIPAPRSTMPGWASPPSSSNIRLGSNTPEPAPPPAIASSPSQPRNPTMMQWNSPLPQALASSPSGAKRPTMSDWGTQVKFDSPPPIAPVLPVDAAPSSPASSPSWRPPVAEASPSGPPSTSPSRQTLAEWGTPPVAEASPSGPASSSPSRQTMAEWGTPPGAEASPVGPASSSPSRQTMAEWGKPPVAEASPSGPAASSPSRQTMAEWGAPVSEPVEPPAPRQTMNEWGASPIAPAGPPAPTSSGSSPGNTIPSAGRQRPTMSDWGTQVGSFDSPPPISPINPVIPLEQLPAASPAAPAEPPRSTLHEWSGSSGSSVAMKPLFSGPASSDSSPLMQQPGGVTVRLGGDPGPESPPPSTPPLFTGNATDYKPEPPTPAQMDELPLPGAAPLAPPISMAETPRTFTEPMGFAWSWSASASPPPGEPPPEPRPSPSLAPRADSAWDQRSNPGIKLEAVVGRDKALDLIASDSKITRAPPTQKEEIQAILRGAKDLLELDDHTGAMELIRKAESIAPTDPEVVAMRERSEKTLLTMFESKLGKLEAIPRVLLKDDEIIWLNLDHRAGFVLAQIDGTVTFDDLFSVSGMTRIDTARILAQLVEEGVISRG